MGLSYAMRKGAYDRFPGFGIQDAETSIAGFTLCKVQKL